MTCQLRITRNNQIEDHWACNAILPIKPVFIGNINLSIY